MKGTRRTIGRIVLFLVAVGVMVGVAGGIAWFFVRQMRAAALQPGAEVDLSSLERTLLGFYLNLRRNDIETPPSGSTQQVEFTIQPGESAAAIASRLERLGIIRDAELFRLLLRYWGRSD